MENEQHHTNTEARLDNLERSAEKTNHRLSSVETTLTGIVSDVKQLLGAVNAVQSRPQFDVFKIAQTAALAIGIFSGTCAGITYIVNAVNAESRVKTETELSFLKQRIDNGWGIGGVSVHLKEAKTTP